MPGRTSRTSTAIEPTTRTTTWSSRLGRARVARTLAHRPGSWPASWAVTALVVTARTTAHSASRAIGATSTQAMVAQNDVETTSPSRTVIRQAPFEHHCRQFKIPLGTTRTAAMAIRVSSCRW